MLELRYNKAKLKQFERELRNFPRALPKVMSKGLTRTASSARTEMSRSLSKRTGLKVGQVKKGLRLEKASYSNWRSAVTVSRKRLSLSILQPQRTAGGLSVKHLRKRVMVRQAFPALKGWFIRLPAAGGYKQTIGVSEALEIDPKKKVGRLPIGRIKGPILARVFAGAQGEANRIYQESLARLEKNIHDQVNLILRKRLPA